MREGLSTPAANTTRRAGSRQEAGPHRNPAPARVRPLLERCVERDPRKRLRDVADRTLPFRVVHPTRLDSNLRTASRDGKRISH
jgi:hypothetical protein